MNTKANTHNKLISMLYTWSYLAEVVSIAPNVVAKAMYGTLQ